jgi:hypothetical protein
MKKRCGFNWIQKPSHLKKSGAKPKKVTGSNLISSWSVARCSWFSQIWIVWTSIESQWLTFHVRSLRIEKIHRIAPQLSKSNDLPFKISDLQAVCWFSCKPTSCAPPNWTSPISERKSETICKQKISEPFHIAFLTSWTDSFRKYFRQSPWFRPRYFWKKNTCSRISWRTRPLLKP